MKRKFKKLTRHKKLKVINQALTLEEFFSQGCETIKENLEWWQDEEELTM